MSNDPRAAAPPALPKPDAAGRRSRLRAYQVQLMERMQEARNSAGNRVKQLGVAIGAERYLLDLTQAGEIVPVAPITEVPLSQPWYLGLANIRGNLVGIVDFALYMGHGATPVGPDSRFITFAGHLQFNCALLVSRVSGLRNAADMELDGCVLRDRDANEWAVLDLAALVQETRFLHVGF